MIHIIDKYTCCGCSACYQVCPKHCITMVSDEEGFLYPQVDVFVCVQCGRCESVCPMLKKAEPSLPIGVFAAKNPNEYIRLNSSSGGIFSMLAEQTLHEGGAVFGATFTKDWCVEHCSVENIEGLAALRGSKYVQSQMGNCYQECYKMLRAGRKVLFSGTPCQIAGLHRFIGKSYENLLTMDLICHGVPSPSVWRAYLQETIARQRGKNSVLSHSIKSISFRDKRSGWKKYSFALTLSTPGSGKENTVLLSSIFEKNAYMRGFLSDLFLRPSCYQCAFRQGRSGSDITLGDFWGIDHIHPEIDDDKGMCAVLVNTEKGRRVVDALTDYDPVVQAYNDVIRYNPAYISSPIAPVNRKFFYFVFRLLGYHRALYFSSCDLLPYRVARKLYRTL